MYTTRKSNGRVDLFPQIDRVLNEIFNTTITHATDEVKRGYSQPSANVKEYGDRFEIFLAVPGVEKDNIAVKVDKNVLSISANVEEKEERKYQLNEFRYGKFERKFKLPHTVDKSAVAANQKNGVLMITLAKREEDVDNGPQEIVIK